MSCASSGDDLAKLEAAYAELRKHHDEAALLAIKTRAAFLRLEFDRCVDATIDWVRHEPFSVEAHAFAAYLLALHAGDYRQAAQVGLAALGRGLNDDVVRDNTAFALAMQGRLDEAARSLPDTSQCEHALGTAGLIEALRGNTGRAMGLYEECAAKLRLAEVDNGTELVRLHRTLARVVAGLEVSDTELAAAAAQRRSGDPGLVIVAAAIERERVLRH